MVCTPDHEAQAALDAPHQQAVAQQQRVLVQQGKRDAALGARHDAARCCVRSQLRASDLGLYLVEAADTCLISSQPRSAAEHVCNTSCSAAKLLHVVASAHACLQLLSGGNCVRLVYQLTARPLAWLNQPVTLQLDLVAAATASCHSSWQLRASAKKYAGR